MAEMLTHQGFMQVRGEVLNNAIISYFTHLRKNAAIAAFRAFLCLFSTNVHANVIESALLQAVTVSKYPTNPISLGVN